MRSRVDATMLQLFSEQTFGISLKTDNTENLMQFFIWTHVHSFEHVFVTRTQIISRKRLIWKERNQINLCFCPFWEYEEKYRKTTYPFETSFSHLRARMLCFLTEFHEHFVHEEITIWWRIILFDRSVVNTTRNFTFLFLY